MTPNWDDLGDSMTAKLARIHIRAAEVKIAHLKREARSWALYCFRHHGDDAKLYNGLATLGGVDDEGKGWDGEEIAP